MSLVWDVQSIAVDDAPAVSTSLNVTTVQINTDIAVPQVTLSVPNSTESVQVNVPGVQGPPGLQNVYIQSNDPAIEYGWGPEETNYVWIPV